MELMDALDLLSFSTGVDEDVMEDLLRVRGIDLHFNGRLVWGDIVAAIVAGKKQLASTANVSESEVAPCRLEVATYHPEEQAIYVAVEFTMPGRRPNGMPITASAEQVIRRGGASGQVQMEAISVGNSAKILEFMAAIDLKRVIWLPYSE